ncbi:cysteine protease [Coniosporium tulheliwenetii]|uniref:Cysteine protease n=1 Tax=Coniosporium tulheliwenetii TaxID=3383036 RepID=A0ACC2ZII3_9PEZI|nr:cysteine protease [Cladosporium sp. JES 115]
MKAEAVDLQASIANATSKDEALELALQAAELCMKALKIATDREQKSDMTSRCQTLLTEAERIKTITQWPLTPVLTPAMTPGPASSPNASPLTLRRETEAIGTPTPVRVKQLVEPVSSGELSKAEKIILLKSSKLNGFTFPPWQGAPEPDEFALSQGAEAFRISPNGKYVVRLNFNGCYRKVVIDDRLPTSKNMRVLHVIDRRNPSLLWPALLEKAYLKVRGGYDFPGSHSGTDLWILTGWIPEQIWLENSETDADQLWGRILSAFNKGDVLITLGTGRMSHRIERQLGLEGEHDYAVLDLKEQGSSRLLCLKNPWCEGTSWKGKLPELSTAESSEPDFGLHACRSPQPVEQASSVQSSSGSVRHAHEQGIFWIDIDNVLRHFQSIFLNWNPGLFSYRQDAHFAWDLSNRLDSVTCFVNHPQFKVVAKGESIVWLLLSRHLKDRVQGAQEAPLDVANAEDGQSRVAKEDLAGYISMFAFDRKGTRVYLRDGSLERAPYVDSPQTLLRLQPDVDITYSIVIDEEDMSSTPHSFTLSAFSTLPVTLDKADSPYTCQRLISSAWTQATAGGNANDPTYSENPQFSLRVVEHTAAAILIQTPSDDIHVHVKLVHGRGRRVYTLTSKDVIADSGQHRRGSAVIEISDLYPDVRFGHSVSRIAAPLVPRRFVCISIVAKFVRSVAFPSDDLLSFNDGQAGARSPLRVTVELGTGPNRRVLIASSGGAYSDAVSGVRTDEVDLSPQMLYTSDMWLVLDRLCGPASGSQEIYGVEVFCDQPKALDIGVWRNWDF